VVPGKSGFTKYREIRDQFEADFDDLPPCESKAATTKLVALTANEWKFLQEGLEHQREVRQLLRIRNGI